MGAKQSDQSSITYLKLKAKTSDSDPTPYIGQNEKSGNGWAITKTFNSIDGHLKEISSESYEYEGDQKFKCKMKLVDNDGSINILESNFNGVLYSILNSLAGTKNIDFINIDVWLGKSKDNSDKRYAQCAVKNNGEKTTWLYEWSNVPKPAKVAVPGTKKTVTDDSNVIEFWEGVIKDINLKLKESPTGNTSYKADETSKNGEMNDWSDQMAKADAKDDLPF